MDSELHVLTPCSLWEKVVIMLATTGLSGSIVTSFSKWVSSDWKSCKLKMCVMALGGLDSVQSKCWCPKNEVMSLAYMHLWKVVFAWHGCYACN